MIGAHAYVGKLIGNYRVKAEISDNGVSCMFRGERNAAAERLVALKLWYSIHLSPQKQLQFLQEIRLLTMLKHPHLLPILESGIDEESPYLVTDYAPKGSLRDRIEGQPGSPLPVQEALTILRKVGLALQYAHHFHLTHGNLKPENILFAAQGDVLLSDFAISTLMEPTDGVSPRTIRMASYLAPEQLQGVTSEASDQYALGCLAYELLTGQVPFPAIDSSGPRHAQESPQPPTLLNMLLPGRMDEAILKALATPQEARHATVTDFLTAVGSASLFQPRMLPVPVTPRPTLPVLFSSAFPAQPTSMISPVHADKHQPMDKGDAPGDAQTQQKSDPAAIAQSIEEEDTVALSVVKEALPPQNMSREQASPPVGVPLNPQVGAGITTHVGVTETKPPIPSSGSHHSRSGSSRFLWGTLVIFSLVVAATIISFSSFGFLSVFSPKTGVQATPQAPTRIPSAGPSAAPSPIPSATPSSTPLPTPTPTRQPSATTSPLPTPSPSPVPELTVTPGQFNAQTDCTFHKHWYTCVATLALPPGAQGSASWSASSSGFDQVTFSPSGGVLSPGQQQQVSISVRSSCPATGSLLFSDGSKTVTVTWSC